MFDKDPRIQTLRSLERARFTHHFIKPQPKTVLKSLKAYQNSDGGFAHGLEPDYLNPNSTPVQTWMACQIMHEIGVDKHHPMVKKTLQYLWQTPDQDEGFFKRTTPENNQYPHAPWWHHQAHEAPSYNPTASLLGFMFTYETNPAHQTMLKSRIKDAMRTFIEQDITEMHEVRCFVELYHHIKADFDVTVFKTKLHDQIEKIIEKDPNLWFESYSVKPSQLILSPDTPGFETMEPLVYKECQHLKTLLNNHDPMPVTWSWEQYPLENEQAKQHWQGILLVESYLYVARFSPVFEQS